MQSRLAKRVIFYLWSSRKSRCICPYFLASISSVACYSIAIWQRQQDLLKNTANSFSLIKHGYPVTIGLQPNMKCMKCDFWIEFSIFFHFASSQFSPLINYFFFYPTKVVDPLKKKRRGGGVYGGVDSPLAIITIVLRSLCPQYFIL